jgi:hypothetical protein
MLLGYHDGASGASVVTREAAISAPPPPYRHALFAIPSVANLKACSRELRAAQRLHLA